MPACTANHILEALLTSLPFRLDLPAEQARVAKICEAVLMVFLCDSASANILALRCLAHYCHEDPAFLFVAETCSVHQLHIVKTSIYSLVGLAGILYSFTKVLRKNSSMRGFQKGIQVAIQNKLQVREGVRPHNGFLELAHLAYGIDGNDEYLFTRPKHPDDPKKPKKFYRALLTLAASCHFDPDGSMVAFVQRRPGQTWAQLKLAAVEEVVAAFNAVFVHSSWNIAALSRWTHVGENLKKLIVGMAAGGVLADAIALMAGKMGVDKQEAELDKILEADAAAQKAGGEQGQKVPWAKHAKRCMKVSQFFQDPGCRWRAGAILVVSSIGDKLLYAILGHDQRNRADLNAMVGPRKSVVAVALAACLAKLRVWNLDPGVPWALLSWLRIGEHREAVVLKRLSQQFEFNI